MDFVKDIIENVWVQRTFFAAFVAFFGFLIYHLVARVLNNREKKSSRIMNSKKNKTFIHMLKSIAAGVISVVTVLMILQIYGVNVTSMLAGVGIAGIVIGFALQDSLKDIIRGFVIVSDDYYEIGDVIRFGNNVGPVVSVSLLTTKIQDINTMNTVSIANRNIDKVEIDPGYIYIPVPTPYDIKIEQAEKALQAAVQKLQQTEGITSAAYQGITAINTSSRDHQIVITCDPANRLQIRRNALRVILVTLEEHKIRIPYTQLDLHTKK